MPSHRSDPRYADHDTGRDGDRDEIMMMMMMMVMVMVILRIMLHPVFSLSILLSVNLLRSFLITRVITIPSLNYAGIVGMEDYFRRNSNEKLDYR